MEKNKGWIPFRPERADMDAIEATSKSIYSVLKEEILNLTIKPGQQISESEICTRFNASRTPVRAAFQRLKDAGLLTIVPYKSTTASLLDFDQIEQSIYMRIAVESMVVRDVIRECDPYVIEKIRAAIHRQEVLLSGEFDSHDFYALDSALHGICFNYIHKESLWKLIQRMQVHYMRFRMLDIVAVQNYQEIYEEHVTLLQAICDKDIDQIEPLMRRHLYGGIKRLGERINSEFADYFTKKVEDETE